MTIIRVFIYGSLLPGQSNHHVVSPFILSSEPGQIAGRLVDAGDYPAVIRDRLKGSFGVAIRGLWISVNRDGLAAMDALEEFAGIEEINDYNRIWVHDVRDIVLQGWVYVWDSDRGYPAVQETYWPNYLANRGREGQ